MILKRHETEPTYHGLLKHSPMPSLHAVCGHRDSGHPHYTKAVECAVCGPVWLWEGAPDTNVQGCPWCLNCGPVPRPGPVLCRDCSHWIPDTINPAGGLGQCEKNMPGLAWATRQLKCDQYQEMA